MDTVTAETKFGKIWTAITQIREQLKSLTEKVVGNGIPGHEARITSLEDARNNRAEGCPVMQMMKERDNAKRIAWDKVFQTFLALLNSSILVYILFGGAG